jgi:hypothetical protein
MLPARYTCAICGRTGNVRFTVVDRYADGSATWRCTGQEPCRTRAARASRVHAKADSVKGERRRLQATENRARLARFLGSESPWT